MKGGMSEAESAGSLPQQIEEARESTPHGLSFLFLLSFVVAFVAARAFATLNPHVVVVTGGIHFHHFWYGLIMVAAAGWAGIVFAVPTYKRVYAVVFGLGSGLIGDEVGLLLTFGDYNSSLTFFYFVVVVAGGSLVVLLGDRKKIENDVMSLANHERTLLAGLAVMAVSTIAIAGDSFLIGAGVLLAGVAIAVLGLIWRRRTHRRRP